jgi:integrase
MLYGKTRQEVAKKLVETLRSKEQGLPVGPERPTVAAYLAQWLKESAKPKLEPSTYRSYEQLVRVHIVPELDKHSLAKLGPSTSKPCSTQSAKPA